MLEELVVNNIALVERVSLRFSPGMNCLSGETGAGKSILAGALGLIRGNKGELDLIRHGAEEASVSAAFLLDPDSEACAWLKERGYPLEDDRVLVRRVIRRNGKGSIYIQGHSATLKDLVELSGSLFDMHGQHEHQNLFNVDMHRLLLDRFGGLAPAGEELYRHFSRLAGLRQRMDELRGARESRERRREELEYLCREIEQARLVPGEDAELEAEKRRINQAERLYALCAQADGALSEQDPAAVALVFSARQAVQELGRIDDSMQDCAQRLESLYFELEDIARAVSAYTASVQFEPGRIDEVEERLDLIARLKKKYGPDIPAILQAAESARGELESLEGLGDELESLAKEIKECEALVYAKAAALSQSRRQAALRLQAAVEGALKGLGMARTRFEVAIVQKTSERGTPVCGPWGIDSIEFQMSANPGEPLRPIKAIASGGEISRVMLAIKGALADSDQVPTLVFDEVDTGIGGEVAVAVGEHLHGLAASKQILAITHLASIAVRADNHSKVEKHSEGDRTLTEVRLVRGTERVEEIARMLAGDRTGDASLRHAAELLARYHQDY